MYQNLCDLFAFYLVYYQYLLFFEGICEAVIEFFFIQRLTSFGRYVEHREKCSYFLNHQIVSIFSNK